MWLLSHPAGEYQRTDLEQAILAKLEQNQHREWLIHEILSSSVIAFWTALQRPDAAAFCPIST